ncbi:hypothetical protein HDU84_007924 [Entophlyctis sp. JEL0112]|nr:hypothetical protein HDU84_007924 [Entophlyctis sp. JEL0112]
MVRSKGESVLITAAVAVDCEQQQQVSASVFWDHENCACPAELRGFIIVRRIKDLLNSKGLVITNIVAIGDVSRMKASLKADLEQSGVVVQSISSRKPSAADIAILGEIMKNIHFHKPPHAIVLISGDRDFSAVLNFLESVAYRVILVHSNQITDVLRHSVRETISWVDLLKNDLKDKKKTVPAVHSGTTCQDILKGSSSTRQNSQTDPPTPQLSRRQKRAAVNRKPNILDGFAPKSSKKYPNSPERALLLLREINRSCLKQVNSASTSGSATDAKVPICEIPSNIALASGFPSVRLLVEWAQSHSYVKILKSEDSISIRKNGFTVINKFQGVTSADALYRATVMDSTEDRFRPLLEAVFEFSSNGKGVKYADLTRVLNESYLSKLNSLSFNTVNNYLSVAVKTSVIQFDESSEKIVCISSSTDSDELGVSIANHPQEKKKFDSIVTAILKRGGTMVLDSILGSDSVSFGWKSMGFKKFSDYLNAAIEAGVVFAKVDQSTGLRYIMLSSLDVVSAGNSGPGSSHLENYALSNDVFKPLVCALLDRGPPGTKIPISIIGSDCQKRILWKDAGYARFSNYVEEAERAGFVRITREDGTEAMIEAMYPTRIYVRSQLEEKLPRRGFLELESAESFPINTKAKDISSVKASSGKKCSELFHLSARSDNSGDSLSVEHSGDSSQFSGLISLLRESGMKPVRLLESLSEAINWRGLGYLKFADYINAAKFANIVSILDESEFNNQTVTLLSPDCDIMLSCNHEYNSESTEKWLLVFRPLISLFNDRKTTSLRMCTIASSSDTLGWKLLGYRKFMHYMDGAAKCGIIKISENDKLVTLLSTGSSAVNASIINLPAEAINEVVEIDTDSARGTCAMDVDVLPYEVSYHHGTSENGLVYSETDHSEIHDDSLADQEILTTEIVWRHGGESVELKGSWDSWTNSVPMTKDRYSEIFKAVLSLPKGLYEYKFIVDGVWLANEENPVTGVFCNNFIEIH